MNINSLTEIRYWDNIGWTRMTKIEPSIFSEIVPEESEIVYTRRSTKTLKLAKEYLAYSFFVPQKYHRVP